MAFSNVADISSAQGSFDAAAYRAGGRNAVIIKATEGTGYTYGGYAARRDAAHGQNLLTGEYHYMGDSLHAILHPADDEAHHFLSAVGHWTPGRWAICDVESPQKGPYLYGMSAQQAAEWCDRFLTVCASEGGWHVGMGYSMSGSGVIQRLNRRWRKWYAAYPGPVPGDRDMHQFTDNGPVPGVGHCDDSYCYFDLAAWCTAPSSTSAPSPGSKEDHMAAYSVIIPPGGEAPVPVPPPHGGAIGWGDVFISLSTDEDPGKAGIWVLGGPDGHTLYEAEDNVPIPKGRLFGRKLAQGVQYVQVRNEGTRPLGVLIEAV